MFNKNKTLHDLHDDALRAGSKVVSIFHDLVDELLLAADKHRQIAKDAHVQAMSLADLRDDAQDAARAAEEKAAKIAGLVS